ncbi:hypothetical protein CSOJ01_00661 [Colletotrichum sojae]|uniref:Uncharacterized protein n=1 Tax=Colletotrichum sojae TaxID=2175907 RepID=A0A8H6N581_9PEZI|nr:hypothetical protein CSOJ01_00661 [Colletotrichum sojae]
MRRSAASHDILHTTPYEICRHAESPGHCPLFGLGSKFLTQPVVDRDPSVTPVNHWFGVTMQKRALSEPAANMTLSATADTLMEQNPQANERVLDGRRREPAVRSE